MRRLWSHIILAATSLLMVGATFATVVRNVKSNIEFTNGREYVFRIYDKDSDGNVDKNTQFDDDAAVKEIASIMEKRLQNAEVSRYEVDIQGNDTIKVALYQEKNDNNSEIDAYAYVRNYLTFDATLAISNSKDSVAYGESFLDSSKKSYVKRSEQGVPTIYIPIDYNNTEFQTVYLEAKEMADNDTGEVEEEVDTEDGEHTHEHHAYLYLWYNYVDEYYTYEKSQSDPTIGSKILMRFDAKEPFDNADDPKALIAYVNPNVEEGATVTAADLSEAYRNARYYVNLLNAEKLNYHVDFLFYEDADLWVDNLENLGDLASTIAWSKTFIATIVAVAVVSLILIYFFRLGALSIASSSIVSTFMGLLFITLFGAEFNIAGIVGLISLAFVSVTSGIIYCTKLKEECYRGRSLKKANAEAAKKALLPTVDLHVILVAVGVACYLLGGILMKGFAVVTILGGLVSLVINLAGLRGLLWLATNEQGLANRYDLFDVSVDQVPNALEEEKQKYFGPGADKDYTKGKKPVGIISLVLFVASVACLIVFGTMYKGTVYGTATYPRYENSKEIYFADKNSEIYIEYYSYEKDDYSLKDETLKKVNTLVDNTYLVDGNNNETQLRKLLIDGEVETHNYSADSEEDGGTLVTKYYAYYRLNLNSPLGNDSQFVYKENGTAKGKIVDAETFFANLDDVDGANTGLDFDNKVTISFKTTKRINADQPAVSSLIVATAVGSAIAVVYLLLRYRLSRGLAALGVTTLSVGISAGVFAMLAFLPVTSYASVALPFIAIFSLAMAVIFANKEREMILEDRSRDNSVAAREEKMKKASGLASTPIVIAFIIALYLGVNFFGFMQIDVSWIFLLMIIGVAIATGLTLVLFGPLAHLLFKWFSNIQIAKPKQEKKKKAPVRVKKSAEPEEAIFIGIND